MLYKCFEEREKIEVKDYIIPRKSPSRRRNTKLFKKLLKIDVKKYFFRDRDWSMECIIETNSVPKNIHNIQEKYDEIVLKYGTKWA